MNEPRVFAHGHGHDHDHDDHHHGHDHDHGHGHGHHHHDDDDDDHDHHQARGGYPVERLAGDAEAHRQPLARGAGRGKLLFFDAFSGVAGDMTVAALVDLGVPFQVVRDAIASVDVAGCEVSLYSARGGAIAGCKFDVAVLGAQPERSYAEIDLLLQKSKLSDGARELAQNMFLRLAEAEATVHRQPLSEVHFHEVGAVDSIADIVGAAACIDYLAAEVVASPLPMGRGAVDCRHGMLPLPAPATVLCLRGVPTYDAGIDGELVTPTGACIVASVAHSFADWPEISPERAGWGFGSSTMPDRLNALRVVLGAAPAARAESGTGTHVVLEANVDDMTGELSAHAITILLQSGALDAWVTPIVMKKGRPALTLSVLVERASEQRLAELVLRETSSLGVRHVPVTRTERPRRIVEVETRFGVLPIKVSEGPYGAPRVKPEFDACAQAAAAAGVSVSEVIAEVLAASRELTEG
ncbi:MAG TPA: nickel pincer cofactor biosynthesis protein LarC [Polyangiaceae bacterium]|jgi:hypothetical protein